MPGFLPRFIGFLRSVTTGHLEWIFRVTWFSPGRSLAITLLLLLLSCASICTIRFEFDIFKLFPAKTGALRLFLDTIAWTGSSGEAYFVLEGEKDKLIPEAEGFASRLKKIEVDGRSGFRRVAYRVVDPDELQSFARFVSYAAAHPQLFITPKESGRLAEALSPRQMDAGLQRARSELASVSGMGMRELIAADPIYLRELILPRLKEGSQALDLDPDSPYFMSRDGRLLIIVAEPARPVQDMEFARKLVEGINSARAGAGVSITCAGAHLSAVIDEAVMKRNIISCIVSSLFVVLGLFYLTYRRVMPTLLIPVIILFGTILALGSAGLFLPSIHIISFAFTALIIGLGTDYSIHLYDRFYSERSAGKEPEEAMRLAMTDTGHGVFTAAVTTALPFLALMISDVRALSELGLLVGLGVLFSLYATLFFMPPLLRLTESSSSRVYRPLPRFGLPFIRESARKRPRLFIAITAIFVAGSFVASLFIGFEGELKNLQPRHSEALLTQERIERHLSLAPKQMVVAVEGAELEDVLARGARVGDLADRYRQQGELAAVSWLGQVVNLPGAQMDVLGKLKQELGKEKPGRMLTAALAASGFDPSAFHDLSAGLDALTNGNVIPPAEAVAQLHDSPFRGMVDRFLVQKDGKFHLLLYLHYRGESFHQEKFLKELNGIDPSARATGPDLVSRQLAESVRRSFAVGFMLGGVLVLLLLVTHFESLKGVVASLAPVLAGVIAMVGLMAATGMKLNFMNSMVLVTILGMGSDYGLHIYHRAGNDCAAGAEDFVQAGRAVLLSALTTIAGFGSLAFTDYGAMSSIGWATNFGIGATALFSLVSLPAFIFLSKKIKSK